MNVRTLFRVLGGWVPTAVVLLLALALWGLSGAHAWQGQAWLRLHLALDLAAVCATGAMLVAAWAIQGPDQQRDARAMVLCFTAACGVAGLHVLSQWSVEPTSTAVAVWYWGAGRAVEALAIAWLASGHGVLDSRAQAQWVGLGLLALLGWGGLALQQWPLDATLAARAYEYGAWGLCLVCLGLAWWLGRRAVARRGEAKVAMRDMSLAAAAVLLGLGALVQAGAEDHGLRTFTGHLGHLGALGVLLVKLCWPAWREPLVRWQQTELALRNERSQLAALQTHVPAGLARLDRQGRYLFVNQRLGQQLGRTVEDIVGRPFEEVVSSGRCANVSYHWALALSGQTCSYEGQTYSPDGQPRYATVWMSPERNDQGEVVGAIAVVLDTTEQFLAEQKRLSSLRELENLRRALDAHAIVAVTDARGVILSVNDKFCDISQYSREELVGKTHRLINSGVHPGDFFKDLWRTIAGGQVWSGEVCNRSKDGKLYWVQTTVVPSLGEDGRPERYIAIRADITARKRYELQVQHMAFNDALTNLPNRVLFLDRLRQQCAQSERTGQYGALLYLDLDHFKQVNDTLGHEQGDELLRQVARRLIESVRQTDTVARLAGDEFVVILGQLGADETVATAAAGVVAEGMLRHLSQPYTLGDGLVNTSSSIGVVMLRDTSLGHDILLKQADVALYQSKDNGRARVSFFDPGSQVEFDERTALELELRRALEHEQLGVRYQPIVDGQGRVRAVEATLLWEHPTRGELTQGAWMGLAEKSGQIIAIGRWAIEQVCAQIARWRDDPVRGQWMVAVNVNARQLEQADFVHDTIEAMDHHHVPAHRLKLEVTESALQRDLKATVRKMHLLRARGVLLAIDNFGAGFSSLSYLKALPVKVLKVDRSYVSHIDRRPHDLAIFKTVLALAEQLRLEVVADGVETDAQFQLLRAHGCHQFQGPLFGLPQLADVVAVHAYLPTKHLLEADSP